LFPRIAILSREIGVVEEDERRVSFTDFKWVFICWSTAVEEIRSVASDSDMDVAREAKSFDDG
jgi:hypothetical protein